MTEFVAIGGEELGEPTETIRCRLCGQEHPIEYGTSKTLLPDNTWTEPTLSKIAGFYKCDGKLYLGTLDGRAIR